MTCPRPHSNAIAKSRLSGRTQVCVPSATTQLALPARVLKPGLQGPAAPLLSRACTRAGGGSEGRGGEEKEGRSLPITKLQDVGVGAEGRGRDGG